MATAATNDVYPPPPSTSPLSQLRLLILEPSSARILPSVSSAQSPPLSLNRLHSSSHQQCQHSLIPPLLQALTGELPPPLEGGESEERRSFAGYTSHPPLRVRTKYFDRRVGIWCDEVPLTPAERVEGRIGRGGSGSVARKEREGASGLVRVLGDEERNREDLVGEFNGKGDRGEDGPTTASTLRSEHDHQSHEPESKEAEEGNQTSTPNEVISDPEDPITTNTWITQMLSPQALEVRNAIGAIILTIPLPDALEPNPDSSSSATITPLPDLDPAESGDNEPRTPQYQHKLKHEYLTLISAVNSLRSTIEEERAEGPGGGSGGDITAIIILQGSLPPSPSSKSLNVKSISRRQDSTSHDAVDTDTDTDEDVLLEAIEEQLLTTTTTQDTETPIMGWDIVIWDGVVTTKPTAQLKAEGGVNKEKDKRNIYGEKTNLPRLLEVLEGVDWTAQTTLPSQVPPEPLLSDSDDELGLFTTTGLGGDGEADEDEVTQVEQLQSLLSQAMAIREAGRDMSRGERERLARKLFLGGNNG